MKFPCVSLAGDLGHIPLALYTDDYFCGSRMTMLLTLPNRTTDLYFLSLFVIFIVAVYQPQQ